MKREIPGALKKLRAAIGTLMVAFGLMALPGSAFSSPLYGWDIPSFKTDITIQEDASIVVNESIVADYTNESHHGIYRYIPIKYRDRYGNKMALRFTLLSVTDENGTPWNYEESIDGDNEYIKIGDADVLLDKPSTFNIKYKVQRAVTYFDDHDELYWNATGTEWNVAMHDVQTTVHLPTSIKDSDITSTCFTGGYGASYQNCDSTVKDHTVTYNVTGDSPDTDLLPREGLTVVVGFPKGIVAKPSVTQQIIWFLMDNWGYFLPILTFAIFYYLWYTRGRDPVTSRSTIMPIYTPPDNLTPSELGTLIDEKVDMRDITSAIIDLAVRGYLKINETKQKKLLFEDTTYEFELLKDFDNDSTLQEHEKLILKAVFSSGKKRQLKDLENKFYTDLPGIKDQIYAQLVSKGYFPARPDKVRSAYSLLGYILLGSVIFGISVLIIFFSVSVIVGLGASGIIILLFAQRMPAKTKKGVDTYFLAKGLEEYINTAEKDRIKFQEKENIFEKLLPYALTLGIAAKWASAFEGLYKNPPSWYSSNDPNWNNNFSSYYLLNRIDHISTNMQTTFASSPRSASGGGSGFSGGFSGGGFGGGGGGSW